MDTVSAGRLTALRAVDPCGSDAFGINLSRSICDLDEGKRILLRERSQDKLTFEHESVGNHKTICVDRLLVIH